MFVRIFVLLDFGKAHHRVKRCDERDVQASGKLNVAATGRRGDSFMVVDIRVRVVGGGKQKYSPPHSKMSARWNHMRACIKRAHQATG